MQTEERAKCRGAHDLIAGAELDGAAHARAALESHQCAYHNYRKLKNPLQPTCDAARN